MLISSISDFEIFKAGKLSWVLSLDPLWRPNLPANDHLRYAQLKVSPAILKTFIYSTGLSSCTPFCGILHFSWFLISSQKSWEILVTVVQAWRGRKRQAHGHHSPSSIQGEWLDIDDQKNNILASLCLASYQAANWLQKLETSLCVCVCVCVWVGGWVGVWYLSLIYIYQNKTTFL